MVNDCEYRISGYRVTEESRLDIEAIGADVKREFERKYCSLDQAKTRPRSTLKTIK